jgi:hypothetical protein
VEEAGAESANGFGHGGAEEARLALAGQVLEDAFDVGEEAHVEHSVRLVQDEHADGVQPDRAALEVVQQAARCGHERDSVSPAQGLDLGVEADAAVDGDGSNGGAVCEFGQLLGDLEREFARGHEDQGEDARVAVARAAFDEGDAERGGLARSRAGLGDHVAALKEGRDGLRLDGCGGLEAHLLEGAERDGVEVHLVKALHRLTVPLGDGCCENDWSPVPRPPQRGAHTRERPRKGDRAREDVFVLASPTQGLLLYLASLRRYLGRGPFLLGEGRQGVHHPLQSVAAYSAMDNSTCSACFAGRSSGGTMRPPRPSTYSKTRSSARRLSVLGHARPDSGQK